MRWNTFLFRSLYYDRWINLSVLLGVICVAAVLTGAMLVGDSVRGSLKALTLDRLGRIDTLQRGATFFSPPSEDFQQRPIEPWTESVPAILLPAVIESNKHITATQIIALPEQNGLSGTLLSETWDRNEIIINRFLADRLNLRVGDTVSLRVDPPGAVPPENTFGHRADRLVRVRVTIRDIIPNHGLGRFSLKADQQPEGIVLLPLRQLQERLNQGRKINSVLYLTDGPERVSTEEQINILKQRIRPTLDDMGITLEQKDDRVHITSSRMLFTDPQSEEIRSNFPESFSGLLHLATSIKSVKSGRETPYSTIIAMDLPLDVGGVCYRSKFPMGTEKIQNSRHETGLRPAVDGIGAGGRPILLNRWTADDLEVEIGDLIELTWFLPDDSRQTQSQTFQLVGIMPLSGFGADEKLAPVVEGFTDEASIADWDPPFPFDAKRIRKKDEEYWDKYRAAPKAIVPLEIGQKLWGSRFGNTTTIVLPQGRNIDEVSKTLPDSLTPYLYGLNFVPVKAAGLAASSGTTPFSVLFLSFSFFIIGSALLLVAMLFRLSVEMKAKRIGIRLAVGWTPYQVSRCLLLEGLILATIGSLFGVLFGILYANIMVHGLTTWWVDAVTVPFLTLYITVPSLLVGFFGGIAMSLIAVAQSTRKIVQIPVKTLLDGGV